ncbi:16S rRNA (guanine(527)-N(7))-methyltransferase RsmG [Treponema sp.]
MKGAEARKLEAAEVLQLGLDELAARGPTFRVSLGAGTPDEQGSPAAKRRAVVTDLLNRYIAEIELFNGAYGLVGAADRHELIIKHILDSLAPLGVIAAHLPSGVPLVADAGSGAGLPGIPLSIALPDVDFALLERMGRRVGFLENTLAALSLSNVDVEQTEVERGRAGRYDLVTFRAFRPLEPAMLKALFRLLAPGGVLAAYKARKEKIEEEMSAIEDLTGAWEAFDTPVPFLEEERRIVIVRQKF